MADLMFREALREALREEMKRDDRVFIIGEDLINYGGPFKVTLGLSKEFPEGRIVDTPISESAFVGAAVGAAMAGLRPIAEVMYMDFLTVPMDQMVNAAAKMCYIYNGELSVPMVLRTAFGSGTRSGLHHSQSLEAWFIHTPGWKVVMPSNPADAKGLLKSAIRDNNPVLFLEHKLLYGVRGNVPDGEHLVPLGVAEVKREGTDVTIIAWGFMVTKAMRAADKLAQQGVSAEVIDPRTLSPLDKDTIVNSVNKTGRLVVVHEAVRTGGFGGEIAAIVAHDSFGYLDAPIERVTAPDTPVPFSYPMEDFYLPQDDDIVAAALRTVGKGA